jgi:hypothetical protein
MTSLRRAVRSAGAAALFLSLAAGPALAASCPAEQSRALVPTDAEICRHLGEQLKAPAGEIDPKTGRPQVDLARYQKDIDLFLSNFCHRDTGSGWVRDKAVRDVGPFVSWRDGDGYTGKDFGTHAPVVIWYSPEMASWIDENRTPEQEQAARDGAPVPAGAILVKEMYPAPAARCAEVDPLKLLPTSGAAIMIRHPEASHDGWYWGWFGWSGWDPDWPASNETNRLAYQGYGQYCMNCHASARDNLTFSSQKNLQDRPGRPLVFLSQNEGADAPGDSQHNLVVLPEDDAHRLGQPRNAYDGAFLQAFGRKGGGDAPTWADTGAFAMPSETYDNVWMPHSADGVPDDHGEYLTSDNCLGCHDAGSTGLHFDMTEVDPETGKLLNLSPYATWRTSPMGLAGRDPIFFAQMASETQTFHPTLKGVVENTCLGCHGIQGERQYQLDRVLAGEDCGTFTREMVSAVPYPPGNPTAEHADYGALARDGISCTTCHRMALGEEASANNAGAERNACVEERQEFLNPENTGFARTFTGSFMVGPADRIIGPFENPRTAPMETALGIVPEHDEIITSSEVCGTCHTVHLPVFDSAGETVGRVYEQLTYPEWAFSAYRTGSTPDGQLPEGKGDLSQSCQACHMPDKKPDGTPRASKVASIQEYSNFPQAEFTKPPEEIDLPVRDNYSQHTLVGLNVFLLKMAQQFPDVLGIRTQDPMLTSKGVDPLVTTEQQMLDQAANATAKLTVGTPRVEGGTLVTEVTVENLAGHKFPSGVGFRRAFLTFEVLDRLGRTLWASGATDSLGRLIDAEGRPIDGEIWWDESCSARIAPLERRHQQHYQRIERQDQAQIYQELVSTPAPDGPAQCGHEAEAAGHLTTSFLSICAEVKDNRLLPHGFLPLERREAIAEALGAGKDMAEDAGSTAVGDDPDYDPARDGGKGRDTLTYAVPLAELKPDGDFRPEAASVRVRLSYQATPPFYLQDRFCTAEGPDRDRLYFLGGHLNLAGTEAADWKLIVADSGPVEIAAQ